ncbi:hypothetical protein N8864_04330 [Gammaproteobacteria bacterium]|nr:hypothetical protein [Gammaproteobacteria bacterium]
MDNKMATLDPTVTNGFNNINLLQPTQFKLIINRKNFPNLEYFCQSIQLPSMDVQAADLPYSRLSAVPIAGDKLSFGTLECMIIVDENLNAYKEMFEWLQRIVQTNEASGLDRSRNNDTTAPTVADITVAILSSHNNTTRTIRYIDCIPTTIGSLPMESTTGDTTIIALPVSFRFSYFELN